MSLAVHLLAAMLLEPPAATATPLASASGTLAAAPAPAPGSLTLAGCFALARGRDETVLAAGEDLVQARLARSAARASLLPQADARNTYYRQERVQLDPGSTGNAFSFANQRNELVVAVRQPLFAGLRDWSFLRSTDEQVGASTERLHSRERELYAEVAREFFAVLGLQAEVEALASSVGVGSERLREVEARNQVGLARRTEVLLVETQLRDDQARLERARNDLVVARELLAFHIGEPGPSALADDVAVPEEIADVAAGIATAAETRSDVLEGERLAAAAARLVDVARGAFLPTLELEAQAILDRQNFSTFATETDWTAELTLSWPLWDWGRKRAEVSAARSRLIQARLARHERSRRVALEVRSTWLTVQSDLAQMKVLEASVRTAEETSRLVASEYREGLATNLEALTANNLLLQSRVARERQRFQTKLDYVTLKLALGELPQPESEP